MRKTEDINPSLEYMERLFAPESALLLEAKQAMKQTGKEGMSVSATEAKMLHFFIKSFQCKKIVEIGCFAGYSALWMAEAMDGGDLYTFEYNKEHAAIAKSLFDKYQGDTKIHLLEGDAMEKLKEIEGEAPFDMVFIDANKGAYYNYLEWSEKHLKQGGLVFGDNSLLFGEVGLDKPERVSNGQWKGMRKFNEYLAESGKFETCFIPTFEGLSVGLKK